MEKILLETIHGLDKEFRKNELAYLALTQKIEIPLRNRWAFSLHNKLKSNFIVSREWHKTDLAVLTENKKPKALIELKAMYSFDAFGAALRNFSEKMKSDEKKAKELAEKSSLIYTVLLVTHPKSYIPEKLSRNEIKYADKINRCLKKFGSSQEIQTKASENVNKEMKDRNIIAEGIIYGGEAFNVKTDILFWICKA